MRAGVMRDDSGPRDSVERAAENICTGTTKWAGCDAAAAAPVTAVIHACASQLDQELVFLQQRQQAAFSTPPLPLMPKVV